METLPHALDFGEPSRHIQAGGPPQGLPTPPFAPPPGWGQVPLRAPLPFPARVQAVPSNLPQRCVEKGCVFPAEGGPGGRCMHHERQRREPALYHSHQPTSWVVAQAKFGVPKRQPDLSGDGPNRDRRRLAAQREAFLQD